MSEVTYLVLGELRKQAHVCLFLRWATSPEFCHLWIQSQPLFPPTVLSFPGQCDGSDQVLTVQLPNLAPPLPCCDPGQVIESPKS